MSLSFLENHFREVALTVSNVRRRLFKKLSLSEVRLCYKRKKLWRIFLALLPVSRLLWISGVPQLSSTQQSSTPPETYIPVAEKAAAPAVGPWNEISLSDRLHLGEQHLPFDAHSSTVSCSRTCSYTQLKHLTTKHFEYTSKTSASLCNCLCVDLFYSWSFWLYCYQLPPLEGTTKWSISSQNCQHFIIA